MAGAVLELFPEAKFGFGPPVQDGFYYDFDLPRALTPEDLAKIEVKMQDVVKHDSPFESTRDDRARCAPVLRGAQAGFQGRSDQEAV
jgi:threonyl-tRNA synthetase